MSCNSSFCGFLDKWLVTFTGYLGKLSYSVVGEKVQVRITKKINTAIVSDRHHNMNQMPYALYWSCLLIARSNNDKHGKDKRYKSKVS